jgi:predicted phosphoadenosine phosphosulfate sulfurtransferase
MTNATSYMQDQLFAWGEGEPWIRDKEPNSIHAIAEDYPRRFYPFFEWFEATRPGKWAFFVGLRAEEGINRFRAVTRHPGYDGVLWSSKTKRKDKFKFYPLYDWGMGDIWRFIHERGVPYNRVYDLKWALNRGIYNTMRVSNLIHEKSFRCLGELPALEPDTYAKLVVRLRGVHCAARHADSPIIYDARVLPPEFASWKEYRDKLLETMPVDEAKRERFRKRFKGPGDEAVYQAQCKRLLIGDWEGSVPITTVKATERPDKFARYRKLF